jgi:hypothetical protein
MYPFYSLGSRGQRPQLQQILFPGLLKGSLRETGSSRKYSSGSESESQAGSVRNSVGAGKFHVLPEMR